MPPGATRRFYAAARYACRAQPLLTARYARASRHAQRHMRMRDIVRSSVAAVQYEASARHAHARNAYVTQHETRCARRRVLPRYMLRA